MDWERVADRRVSRRGLFGATGALASVAGLAAIGCGGGKKAPATAGPGSTATARPGGSPAATSSRAVLSERHGETLRYTGYLANSPSFDPHKTQAEFYGQQSLVYSRLLSYVSQVDGTIVPDLATAHPERPDGQTLIFTLNPAARWHHRDPVNGRPVVAEDVKYSIERQITGDSSFVSHNRWAIVDTIEAPSTTQLKVRLKIPFANAEGLFADVNSFVVPHELASASAFSATNQLGSGPFRWVEWNQGTFASVARNEDWFGGDKRPYLDGIELRQPKNDDEIEAGLRTKALDAVFVRRELADRLRQNIPSLVETQAGQSLYFGTRFFITQAPFDDGRFRAALSYAINRRAMVDAFFGGSGDINPWVSWPIKRWTLPQSELTNFPGYRPGTGGRQVDIADAKAMLAAYAAEKTVPTELTLSVEAVAEQTLGLGRMMAAQIGEALGITVHVNAMNIDDLVRAMIQQQAPWVAGPDTGRLDLDDWVYPYYHSAGTNNSFPVRDAELDGLIERQRVELQEDARRDLGYEIQRRILNLHAGENFVSERVIALAWPYVRGFPLDTQDGYQSRFADTWIDRSDASFRGR